MLNAYILNLSQLNHKSSITLTKRHQTCTTAHIHKDYQAIIWYVEWTERSNDEGSCKLKWNYENL